MGPSLQLISVKPTKMKIDSASVTSLYDSYNLRARVAPVFILAIPVVVSIAAWVPGILSLTWGSATIVLTLGFSMLVAQFGRHFGKQKEQKLWESWHGPPTTRFLRHRDTTLSPALRTRYHDRLRALQPDLKIPTAKQEAKDPKAADAIYGAVTRYLITMTRDQEKFPLIFKENVNYGFLRNLWGMKPFGLPLSTLGTIACTARLWLVYNQHVTLSPEGLAGALISLALLICWLFWVTPNAVRIAADAYAERLLEACETLK